ncbi:MAG: alpha/beta hydrolase [Anaerolineales bacterium]
MNNKENLPGSAFRGQLYGFFLGISGIKRHFRRMLDRGAYPDQPDPPPGRFYKDYAINENLVEGRRYWKISPRENPSRKNVLYLHGGAYVTNIKSIHWDLIGELISRTGVRVIVPDYPLAPTANFRVTYDFLAALYNHLIQEISPGNLVIMGDSAGGGLALGFAQQLRNFSLPLPSQLILLSPWLDITMTNPAVSEIVPYDKILDVPALIKAGKAYAGDLDPRDFRVSPIYGDLQNLPPISLFIGTHEVLMPDARKFKDLMNTNDFRLNYYEYPHMFHVWITITRLPEARQAIDQVANLLRESEI